MIIFALKLPAKFKGIKGHVHVRCSGFSALSPFAEKKQRQNTRSPGILVPEPLGASRRPAFTSSRSVLGLGLLGPLSQSSLVVSDLDPVTLAGTIQTGQSIEGLVE